MTTTVDDRIAQLEKELASTKSHIADLERRQLPGHWS